MSDYTLYECVNCLHRFRVYHSATIANPMPFPVFGQTKYRCLPGERTPVPALPRPPCGGMPREGGTGPPSRLRGSCSRALSCGCLVVPVRVSGKTLFYLY